MTSMSQKNYVENKKKRRNNMSYYRIQIDELQNGEKRYIPQKGELRISRSWIQRQEIKWYNIIQEGGRYGLSTTRSGKKFNQGKILNKKPLKKPLRSGYLKPTVIDGQTMMTLQVTTMDHSKQVPNG